MKLYPSIVRMAMLLVLQSTGICWSQTVHNTLIDATPMQLNPAFSGNFDGAVRVIVHARTSHNDAKLPYDSYGLSVDLPIYRSASRDYFGLGGHFNRETYRLTEQTFSNFNGEVCLSYHKLFGGGCDNPDYSGSELAIGVQGGHASAYGDISRVYFNNVHYVWLPGYANPGKKSGIPYNHVNAGIAFSQSVGKNFQYVLGGAVNNINQPSDSMKKMENKFIGYGPRITGVASAIISFGGHWSLHPAVVGVSVIRMDVIAGNEFRYAFSNERNGTTVFCGLWYRTENAKMVTAGVNLKNFRVSMGMDIADANGKVDNGFELSIGYINRGHERPQLKAAAAWF